MYYDAKHKCKEQAIKVGDVVRVKKPGFIKKGMLILGWLGRKEKLSAQNARGKMCCDARLHWARASLGNGSWTEVEERQLRRRRASHFLYRGRI
ncbi:hypothetical protein NDU88_002472 [Pleurodeles waltl]|uniref:Uncharacterized protein n=1 Tax=Pleurodeles waltl TaxID=8319 RepID=A0AAV7Q9G4_PLEWA|nr:hypothetical protein NDU88_002472 [Pleurodeles waltl]